MILITYHAVDERRSPVCISPAHLRRDLVDLGRAGYRFVSMDACADWMAAERDLPELSAAITFDDGYASVVEHALPILTDLHVPAIVFVIAGRIGAGNDWPGQWASVPPMRLADAGHLRALADAGLEIGAHSTTHPSLPALPLDRARSEIQESGDRLEQMLGRPVRHFAYPYGARGKREQQLARERYRAACASTPGVATRSSDRYDLPRLDAHDVSLALRLGLTASSVLPSYLRARRNLRRVRQIVGGAR